jgi:peptidoglycan/xylan/chitin deacetylase (PgdA/CDA1 family)
MRARPRSEAGIAILTYHSLDDDGAVLSVAPSVFAEQMRWLSERGFQTLPLAALGDRLRDGRLPESAVILTFDDGFHSVYDHGLPVLRRYGFTATLFLVTDYCGRDNSWPSQPSGIPRRALLDWRHVRELAEAGWSIGAHSRRHPDLCSLRRAEAEEEIAMSKAAIEAHVGGHVEAFAYPYGTHDPIVKAMVGRHFRVACSTALGFAGLGSDPLALERIDMYYFRSVSFFRRLFSPEMRAYLAFRRVFGAGHRRLFPPSFRARAGCG